MGRYTGPNCRLCRRAGEKLFLKGDRCFTPKCAVEARHTPPGAPLGRRRRLSDFGTQMREKQKRKQIYGVMETQFRRFIDDAFNKPGITGFYLMQTLERRLDNVVYRLGFADSRKQARQIVLHGHILVNGVKTDISSYIVEKDDVIAWKESVKTTDFYKERTDGIPKKPVPAWLSLDLENMTGRVTSLPSEEDVQQTINSRLIVEFYSR